MNNKIFFSFMIFVFSLLVASEKEKAIFDKTISAVMNVRYKSLRNGQEDNCVVVGKQNNLTMDDLTNDSQLRHVRSLDKKSEFSIDNIVKLRNGSFQIKGSSLMLAGILTQDFDIVGNIGNHKNIFQQRIKFLFDVYKKNNNSQDPFFVHLLKARNSSDVISLRFTEDQVKQIIQKPSVMRLILAGLGITGFIALLYYFDFYSKGMKLLGRG